ncbi:MAG: hypothetical protein HYZ75_09695 [Elusimicrobia bacterium]|nr:hypothetical protein [Elusimicrobiota bacterium]
MAPRLLRLALALALAVPAMGATPQGDQREPTAAPEGRELPPCPKPAEAVPGQPPQQPEQPCTPAVEPDAPGGLSEAGRSGVAKPRGPERAGREAAAMGTATDGARALLGALRQGAGTGRPGGVTGAPPSGQTPDIAALNRTPGAQSAYASTLQTSDVPGPAAHGPGPDLHAMGDSLLAPAPTLLGRAASLAYRSGPVVAQDLAAMRAGLEDFSLPASQAEGLASSQAPLGEFVSWAKTVKDGALPSISYGILSEGEVGRYSPGLLGPGSITLNHYIRDLPAAERSAVLFHELYHYWDNKVARLHYANVSYGFIDPAHMAEHEYDAYYMTAQYWRQTKPEGASSRLAQFLDKLPADPTAVRAMVDGAVRRPK